MEDKNGGSYETCRRKAHLNGMGRDELRGTRIDEFPTGRFLRRYRRGVFGFVLIDRKDSF